MFKTKGTYCFDAFGAEHFHAYFNDCIQRYGGLTVMDVFTNPLLLGLDDKYLVRNEEDFEEFTKFNYAKVGWNQTLPMTKMFDVKKERYMFTYILNLPDYVSL